MGTAFGQLYCDAAREVWIRSGRFVPKLRDHITQRNFIQEPAVYRKRLQPIFGAVEFGARKALKKALFRYLRWGWRKTAVVRRGSAFVWSVWRSRGD